MSSLIDVPLDDGEILILEAVREGHLEHKSIREYMGTGVSSDELYRVVEGLVQRGYLQPTEKYGSKYTLTMKGVSALVQYNKTDEAEELRKTVERLKKSMLTEKVIIGSTGGGVLVGVGISLFTFSFLLKLLPNLSNVLNEFLLMPQHFSYGMFAGVLLIIVGIVLALKR